jgi:hypothetical protein
MKEQMKILIILIFFLLLSGCEKSTEPINDPTSQIKGVVTNEQKNELIDSVWVGFKNPNIPDSLIFIADSASIEVLKDPEYLSPFTSPFLYSTDGKFQFGFAFASKPPVNYELMFAFKPGYKLWRFNSLRDTVYHLNGNTDSIMIKMLH